MINITHLQIGWDPEYQEKVICNKCHNGISCFNDKTVVEVDHNSTYCRDCAIEKGLIDYEPMRIYHYEVYLAENNYSYDELEGKVYASSYLDAKKKVALIIEDHDPSVTNWEVSIEAWGDWDNEAH